MAEILQKYGVIPPTDYEQKTVTLVFNRVNGVFIAATDLPLDMCDTNDLHCAYVSELMDINKEEIVGTLKINADGSFEKDYIVQDIKDGAFKVYESQLDTTVAYKITKEYTVVDQINILAKTIKRLTDIAGVDTSELDEYLDYVKSVKDVNKAHKEFYQTDPNVEYISNVEQAERANSIYEGGLHEIIGPRTIDGGVVF